MNKENALIPSFIMFDFKQLGKKQVLDTKDWRVWTTKIIKAKLMLYMP